MRFHTTFVFRSAAAVAWLTRPDKTTRDVNKKHFMTGRIACMSVRKKKINNDVKRRPPIWLKLELSAFCTIDQTIRAIMPPGTASNCPFEPTPKYGLTIRRKPAKPRVMNKATDALISLILYSFRHPLSVYLNTIVTGQLSPIEWK